MGEQLESDYIIQMYEALLFESVEELKSCEGKFKEESELKISGLNSQISELTEKVNWLRTKRDFFKKNSDKFAEELKEDKLKVKCSVLELENANLKVKSLEKQSQEKEQKVEAEKTV